MNICVWSILEVDACASSHNSLEALKGSLSRKHGTKYPQETLRKAVDSFKCRLARVKQARGGHNE